MVRVTSPLPVLHCRSYQSLTDSQRERPMCITYDVTTNRGRAIGRIHNAWYKSSHSTEKKVALAGQQQSKRLLPECVCPSVPDEILNQLVGFTTQRNLLCKSATADQQISAILKISYFRHKQNGGRDGFGGWTSTTRFQYRTGFVMP
jgi:hypothetical protein